MPRSAGTAAPVRGVVRRGLRRVARTLGLRLLRVEDGRWLVASDGVGARRVTRRLWLVGDPEPVDALDVIAIGPRSALLFPQDVAEVDRELRTSRILGERHVGWLLEAHAVDCVVDVGANVGQFAQRLRRLGYEGHIASVEPVPAYAAQAAREAAGDERWTVHQMALGDREGELSLWVTDVFTSAWEASEFGRRRFEELDTAQQGEHVTVPQHRLDTVWDELLAPVRAAGVTSPRVYLKLDTQGFDLHVFAGLGERVSEVVGMQSETALLSIYEHMPRLPEALAVYEGAGFHVTGFFPVSKDHDGRVIEYDCTLVRHEAPDGSDGSDAVPAADA